MKREEAIQALKKEKRTALHENKVAFDMAIKALGQQDRIIQILDDYDLEAWEILEKIKEVVIV